MDKSSRDKLSKLMAKHSCSGVEQFVKLLEDPEFNNIYQNSSRNIRNRDDILDEARLCVSNNRNAEYGEPRANHKAIAELWNTYLSIRARNSEYPIEVADVSAMLILMKVARLGYNLKHSDSWIDIAGYAACGGEIAIKFET